VKVIKVVIKETKNIELEKKRIRRHESSVMVSVIVQGLPKKCIHTLTKENCMLYVSTNFNYTSQVEYTLQ